MGIKFRRGGSWMTQKKKNQKGMGFRGTREESFVVEGSRQKESKGDG